MYSPKTSVKFLFSFAALIFFPPQGLSVWHQPLSCRCKGMAAGFGNILLLLLVLLKNISNAFKNYLDFFIKNQRLLFHDWYSPCFSFLPPKETLASQMGKGGAYEKTGGITIAPHVSAKPILLFFPTILNKPSLT